MTLVLTSKSGIMFDTPEGRVVVTVGDGSRKLRYAIEAPDSVRVYRLPAVVDGGVSTTGFYTGTT